MTKALYRNYKTREEPIVLEGDGEEEVEEEEEDVKRDMTLKNSGSSNTIEGQGRKGSRVQKIIEKGKANLSRSKSEISEHNRRILNHLSKGKSEISENNKRLLANFYQRVSVS